MPWPLRDGDRDTRTGATAVGGGVATAALEATTAVRVGGGSFTCEHDVTEGSSGGSDRWMPSPMETERNILALELAVGLM